MHNFHKLGIETNGRTGGRMKTFCPKCHDSRKNKRDKSLSVNLDTGLFNCHYCGWKGSAAEREWTDNRAANTTNFAAAMPDHFRRPTFDVSDTTLPEKEARWFVETRCIPQKVLQIMGVTSRQEFMPQTAKKEHCVCFNYFENGELVNTKFRDGAKNFKMVAEAELIPYNIDGIHGTEECIITEGEIDALSFAAIGRTDVVSVPSGANRSLTWLDRFVESHFEDKRVIYIAVDNDRKGLELRAELLRRFGAERCRVVSYGPDCKDANEHLVKYGAESLRIALEQAPEIPLEGVFTADDVREDLRSLFENGLEKGADTGLENFDRYCTFELKRLCVITGVPGSGKSEFTDELVLRLCLRHEWRAAYFSPENMPLAYHLRKLSEKLTGCHFKQGFMTEMLYQASVRFLNDNMASILPEEDYTVTNILSKARELVRRRGIRILVIDPFNRLEHQIPAGQTETQYISAFIDQLSNFAQRNDCLVILVAHPRKMNREPGSQKDPVPTLYDINGSAAFVNKCDFGLVVERDRDAGLTRIHVRKIKFRHLGDNGSAPFVYNTVNGRYTPCEEHPDASAPSERITGVQFDCSSWLKEAEAVQGNILM
ncbi:bifunctional DNA primase/helicase [uncultured Bacteroides sp.]|uniref:bifunctional DNA primase/helicase n=1 Tax=uncultured Bacteroides sp. TaxID=162156 RepID=UPI002AA67AA5|nr:bifunctional DNA primase/helicase [uncultured Bacteroides sp.]